jgi:phage/plasmid-associated DNA primase
MSFVDYSRETGVQGGAVPDKIQLQAIEKIADAFIDADYRGMWKSIFADDNGLANLYWNLYYDQIKMNEKDGGYQLNIKNNLWEPKTDAQFISELADILPIHINGVIKQYKQMMDGKVDIAKLMLATGIRYEKDNDIKEGKLDPEVVDIFINRLKEKIEKAEKIRDRCQSANKARNIYSLVRPKLIDIEFLKKLDRSRHLISFSNRTVYDIKEGKTRERRSDDYLSFEIPLEYPKVIDKKIMEDICLMVLRICNDDKIINDSMLRFLGYCVTGEVIEQKFLLLVGAQASNGKSTLLEMLAAVFTNKYVHKFHSNTFNKNYPNLHKQLAKLRENPCFLTYIEEVSKEKLDTNFIKEYAGAKELNTNVMYGNSVNFELLSKLVFVTNNQAIFDVDPGILRRGLCVNLTNKFLDKKDYDKLKDEDKKGKYIKDEKLIKKFESSIPFKQAFVKLILDYATLYYKEGLIVSDTLKQDFAEVAENNDLMKDVIDEFFIITDNSSDFVHKDEIVDLYNHKYKTKKSWQDLSNDIKRHLKYNKEKAKSGKRGCYMGIRSKLVDNDLFNN